MVAVEVASMGEYGGANRRVREMLVAMANRNRVGCRRRWKQRRSVGVSLDIGGSDGIVGALETKRKGKG